MYNEQIEKLIELALADGELTQKEKDVLFRKAMEAGIDLDEFELVLEGKLHARQKEGVHTKKADNVIKCPSCGDIIPALSKVCPSCGFVVSAGKKSSEAEKGLEDLISDIEDNLVEIKSLKQPSIFVSLYSHSYIVLPILTLLMLIRGFSILSPPILPLILVCALGFLSWLVIKKKMNEGKSNKPEFHVLKATFEKHSRTAKTLFGENKKVELLLEELNEELTDAENKRQKNRVAEYILYGVLTLMTISMFFIPTAKSELTREEKLYEFRETVLQHINEGDIKKAEEHYMPHAKGSDFSSWDIDDLPITIMQAYVDKGLLNDAESFLSKGHTSYKLDDIAKPLVMAYIKKDDIESAKRIISVVPENLQDGLNKMLPESNEKPKTQNKAVSKPKDIIQEDAGKFVTANVARVYFYDEPAMNSRTDNFFVRGQKAKIIEDYGDFIEVDFEYKGNHTKGFVLTYEVTQ